MENVDTLESLRTMEKYLEQHEAARAFAAEVISKHKAKAKAAKVSL